MAQRPHLQGLRDSALRALRSDRARSVLVGLFLVFIMVLCAIPFFGIDTPDGADTEFHINRIRYLAQALSEGSFPARMQSGWVNDHTYPISIMYGDLLLYPGALATLGGMPVTLAYNLTVIGANVLTVVLSYAALKVMTASRAASVLGTALWCLCFFRIFDFCPRGAYGEFQASVFFPLIACGIFLLFSRQERVRHRRPWLWLGLGVSAVVYTHVLSTFIVLLVGIPAVLVGLFIRHDRRVWVNIGVGALTVLLLTAAFWVPFLDFYLTVDMRVNSASGSMLFATKEEALGEEARNALDLEVFGRMFISMGLRSTIAEGEDGRLPVLEVGIPPLLAWAFAVIAIVVLWRRSLTRSQRIAGVACIVGILLLLYISSKAFFWDAVDQEPWKRILALLLPLQFPWRLLLPASYLSSIMAAFAFLWLRRSYAKVADLIALGLVAVSVVAGIYFIATFQMEPQPLSVELIEDYADQGENEVSMGEFVPRSASRTYLLNELWNQQGVESFDLLRTGTATSFTIRSEDGGSAYIPQFWYKYQELDLSGFQGEATIFETDEGTIGIEVGPGSRGEVIIRFQPPWFWHAALWVTYLTVAGLVGYAVYRLWRRRGRVHEPSPVPDRERAAL